MGGRGKSTQTFVEDRFISDLPATFRSKNDSHGGCIKTSSRNVRDTFKQPLKLIPSCLSLRHSVQLVTLFLLAGTVQSMHGFTVDQTIYCCFEGGGDDKKKGCTYGTKGRVLGPVKKPTKNPNDLRVEFHQETWEVPVTWISTTNMVHGFEIGSTVYSKIKFGDYFDINTMGVVTGPNKTDTRHLIVRFDGMRTELKKDHACEVFEELGNGRGTHWVEAKLVQCPDIVSDGEPVDLSYKVQLKNRKGRFRRSKVVSAAEIRGIRRNVSMKPDEISKCVNMVHGFRFGSTVYSKIKIEKQGVVGDLEINTMGVVVGQYETNKEYLSVDFNKSYTMRGSLKKGDTCEVLYTGNFTDGDSGTHWVGATLLSDGEPTDQYEVQLKRCEGRSFTKVTVVPAAQIRGPMKKVTVTYHMKPDEISETPVSVTDKADRCDASSNWQETKQRKHLPSSLWKGYDLAKAKEIPDIGSWEPEETANSNGRLVRSKRELIYGRNTVAVGDTGVIKDRIPDANGKVWVAWNATTGRKRKIYGSVHPSELEPVTRRRLLNRPLDRLMQLIDEQ